VVNFTSASQRIPGIPIFVNFPTDGNPNNGLESELQVVVPGGISSGNVELRVDGIDAGARGYDARPQIANQPIAFLKFSPALSQFTVFHHALR
jgi:hypothetical protein